MVNIKNLTVINNEHEPFLGYLTWYSIGKQLINVTELEDKLVSVGLEKEWMPNRIRSSDAFRRATKELEQRTSNPRMDVYQNILVREVYRTNKEVQRNLVVETVDRNGKRLSYDSKGAVILLDKKNHTISFTAFSPMTNELCLQTEKKFNLYRNHFSSQQLRVMVQKIIQSLAPTPVRNSGGIWFVPFTKRKELTRLINFINSLDNSEGYQVPVINSNDNRKMVRTKLNDYFLSILEEYRNKTNLRKGEMKELISQTKKCIEDYQYYNNIATDRTKQVEQIIIALQKEVSNILSDINE
ncbi:DUF6744 family protein [Oceanobacillus oncorhynchi]|uniref:DUF6744 family protein n=1 Tax=Oceanobacillus oncorhynchi TaxID=545501 RepID=UPI0018690BC1|nr:DUF6744 family protein [Oceanobacillus oncorhynchi]